MTGNMNRHITILVASETGNSLDVAGWLAQAVKCICDNVQILETDEYDASHLVSEDILLMVTSTQGMGEPPTRAQDFYDTVMGMDPESQPMRDVAFAVLGLGDSAYMDDFNRMSREFDHQYELLGGRRLAEHGECDYDYEQTAPLWIKDFMHVLEKEVGTTKSVTIKTSEETEKAMTNSSVIAKIASNADANTMQKEKDDVLEATLVGRTLLTSPESGKRVFNIKLRLDAAAAWCPGDLVSVVYPNTDATIDNILAHVSPLAFKDPENPQFPNGSEEAEVKELLRCSRDITKNSIRLMERYAKIGGNQDLLHLLSNEGEAREWAQSHPTTSLFVEFPSQLRIDNLPDLFTGKNSRLYSISNTCPAEDSADERVIGLTVSEVSYSTNNGQKSVGACSGYLAEAPLGEKIRLSILPDPHFHMPSDSSTPIIMIAFGSAVAPFRAFLQESERNGTSRPAWLIFGDRSPELDFLYQRELEEWERNGLLSRLDTAWSRYGERRHVQELLPELGTELLRWLDDGAELYLCGHDRGTLKSVQDALETSIGMAHSSDSTSAHAQNDNDIEWAKAYMNQLRDSGRIHA